MPTLEEWLETLPIRTESLDQPLSTDKWLDELPSREEEKPWWQTGWEAVTGRVSIFAEWVKDPERQTELEDILVHAQQTPDMGAAYTGIVRTFVPGAGDLPDWPDQPLWQKAWTVSRFASGVAVGMITTGAIAGMGSATKAQLRARYPRLRTYKPGKVVISKKTGLLETKLPKAEPKGKITPKRFVKPEAVKPEPTMPAIKPRREIAEGALREFTKATTKVEESYRWDETHLQMQKLVDRFVSQVNQTASTEASKDAGEQIADLVMQGLPKIFDPRMIPTLGAQALKLAATAPDQITTFGTFIALTPKLTPEEEIVEKEMVKPLAKAPPSKVAIPDIEGISGVAKGSANYREFLKNLHDYVFELERPEIGVHDDVMLGRPEFEEGPTDIHLEQLQNAIAKEYGSLEAFYKQAKAPPRGISEDLILAMKDTETGEIVTATPDEKIHTDMMARVGERYKDMEPGWVDSEGTFYDVFSGRRTWRGFEPTAEIKREWEEAAMAEVEPIESLYKIVQEKGGIKNTGIISDYGKYTEIPLGTRRKEGLPLDEMAEELGIETENLWYGLTRTPKEPVPGREVLARPLVAEPTVEPTVPEILPPPLPEIRRTEIIKHLSDDLGVPIKLGHFRQRAAGIYKKKPQIIRLKAPIDVPTAAHEIGHYLHREVFKFDLPKYKEELVSLDPKRINSEEGLAEFVNLYVTDPDRAQKLAPDFYDHFDAQVGSIPEIKGMLRIAGDDYQRWLKLPSAAKVSSQIATHPQKCSIGFREGVGKLYTLMVDELYPLKRYTDIARKKGFEVKAEDDPFILATLHRGWHGKADAYLQHKTFDVNYQWSGEPLNAILADVTNKDALRDFDSYLVAKQAVFRIEHGKKVGVDRRVATEAIGELEEEHPEFRDLSKRIYDYQDRLLQYTRDSGLISQSSYEKFRVNLSYVPLHRVMEELGSRGQLGKGFADLPNIFKRFKGSEREIIPPTESIVKHTYLLIDAAERNQVARALTKLADLHPELGRKVEKIPGDMARVAQLSEEEISRIVKKQGFDLGPEEITELANVFRPSMFTPKGNIVRIVENGKPSYYEIDPDIYRSLEMLDRESSNLLIQMLSYPARMLRLGAVSLSPEFLVRNPMRDAFTAMVYSKGGFIPGIDSMRGIWSAIGHDELYWKWKISGGEHSMLVSLDRQYMQQDVKALTASRMQKVKNVIKHPLESARMLAEFGEEATRIGEYRLVQQGGKRWWLGAERIPEAETERERMLRAGYAAREVTLDFARLGAKTKAVNQIIAFWNANVQDMDKIRRSFQGNPIRTLLKIFAGIAIPSVLLWLANKDDERVQELPQWQRDLFWIIPTEKTLWRIPKPFTLGILFGSGPERMLDYMNDNDPESIKQYGRNVTQGMMPGILPTAFLAPMEIATNYSFFLERPVVSESLERLPPELQYNAYTTDLAKRIGEILGISPEKVEHLVRGWTGGFGRLAMETGDAMTQALLGEDRVKAARTLADVPVIRGFVAREPWGSSESVNRLYTYLEAAERGAGAIKQMRREKNREKILEYQERYPEHRFIGQLRSAARELADLRAKRNAILNSDLSPEDKLQRITIIEKQMTKRAEFTVRALRKLL